MSDVSYANRRIHSRHTARIAARLSHADNTADGTIDNIGEGGVFFATEDLELCADEGAPVVISFACMLAGKQSQIERTGTVLRAERYFDGTGVVRAFAIKFDEALSLDDVAF